MIIFYNRFDKTKEPIGVTKDFSSIKDAEKYFSKIKNLTLKEFLRLFIVEIRL